MEFLGSPLITIVLNIAASALVSKGVLDSSTKDAFIQLANNAIAGVITTVVALYSIYKIIDLHKHKISTTMTTPTTKTVTEVNNPPPPTSSYTSTVKNPLFTQSAGQQTDPLLTTQAPFLPPTK